MLAKEIMNRIVTAASRRTNGRDLFVKLLSGMYSGLPVVDGGKIVGVVTDSTSSMRSKKARTYIRLLQTI